MRQSIVLLVIYACNLHHPDERTRKNYINFCNLLEATNLEMLINVTSHRQHTSANQHLNNLHDELFVNKEMFPPPTKYSVLNTKAMQCTLTSLHVFSTTNCIYQSIGMNRMR
jgi:hypothetical protein